MRTSMLALAVWAAICLGCPVAQAAVSAPRVIPRAGWGADESLRFNAARQEIWPRTFWPVQKVIVHHTETQNHDPNPAATIRAIYHDDVRLKGLGDIAYNFLIDEQGRIYEGRYSRAYLAGETPTGEDQLGEAVAGAHAYGHNSGTVGIALLGSFTSMDATPRARAALEALVAWIAARHHLDPSASSAYRNPATGALSVLPNVAGHRDAAETDCPGQFLYAALPAIRADVASLLAGRPVPLQPSTRPGRGKRPQVTGMHRRESRAIERVLRRHPVVSAGGGRRREIALSFHEGPGPFTPQIVQVLHRMHAPATFFDIGSSIIYFSDAAVAERKPGFEVGSLTESFAGLTSLSKAGQRREIRDQAARLRSLGLPSPRLFSPPYGSYDHKTLDVLRRLRMLMVLWSVDPRDSALPGVKTIIRRALRRARPGAIILLHDAGGDRTQTVQALPAIVRGLRSRGYKLVTVARMMLHDPPRP